MVCAQRYTYVDFLQNRAFSFRELLRAYPVFFTPQSPTRLLPGRDHLQFKIEKARTYYGAAEGHGGLCIFPAPHGPLSKVTLDGDLGTLAPLQGLSPSWASHRCWALGPSGWEGQALVLGPLFIVRVQLLWGL